MPALTTINQFSAMPRTPICDIKTGYLHHEWRIYLLDNDILNATLNIAAGTGLTYNTSSFPAVISIANTTVTAGAYGASNRTTTFTVNAQGQLTAATQPLIAISNTQVTGDSVLTWMNM